jgi:hypothetical protein
MTSALTADAMGSKADVQSRRLRMPCGRGGEHLVGRLELAKLQQVVAPIEDVLLGRRRVRGPLILVVGRDEIFGALVHVAEQVVEVGRILR